MLFTTRPLRRTPSAGPHREAAPETDDDRAIEELRAELFTLRAAVAELTVAVQSIRAAAQSGRDASETTQRLGISDVA